ncbi:MAG: TonB family protein [Bacteroidetes bacterium]|nr:TonB family protein [Bacteroidota bacterium]
MKSGLKILCLVLSFLSTGICFSQKPVKTRKEIKYSAGEMIKEEFYVLKNSPDVKQGHYNYFFRARNMIRGNYDNGKKEGEWIYYNFRGQKIISGNYHLDEKNGTWQYFADNRRICEMYYENGLPSGTWFSFFPNDSVLSVIPHKNHKKQGRQITYYEDRSVKSIATYINDTLHGEYKKFYPDGQPCMEIRFQMGKPDSLFRMYYNNKQLFIEAEYDKGRLISVNDLYQRKGIPLEIGTFANGNGNLNIYNFQAEDSVKLYCEAKAEYVNGYKSGRYIEFKESGSLYQTGIFDNGVRCGTWKVVNILGDTVFQDYEESCVRNEFDAVDYFVCPVYNITPFNHVELKPEFPGGETELLKFLTKNTHYPVTARESGIQGRIFIEFVIEKTGEPGEVKIKRGVHPLLDKEGLRVIRMMPVWTPGIDDGFPVRVQYLVPLNFKLG